MTPTLASTSSTGSPRRVHHRAIGTIAAALAALALVVPASAGAQQQAGSGPGAPLGGHSSTKLGVALAAQDFPQPSTADDGFNWADAEIGAGVALAAVAIAGLAAIPLRRRTGTTRSIPTSA